MNFLLQSSICMLVFYSFYHFFLKKNSFFDLQRAYLLLGLIFSLILPLVEINWINSGDSTLYVLSESLALPAINTYTNDEPIQLNTWNFPFIIYITGVFFMITRMAIGILKVLKIIKRSEIASNERGDKLIVSNHNLPTSSFYKYIFLDQSVIEDQESLKCILVHERKHITDRHFFDLMGLELLRAFYWFNPFIYFYSHEIRRVHEFICDKEVLSHSSQDLYERSLIKSLFKRSQIPLLSTFSKISIKTRLDMMSKKKSGKFEKIKFASMIPLILVMLFAFNPADANPFEDLKKGKKVFGKVISEDGKALPGVKIKIDGEDKGATDLMGNYEIPLSGSNESIEFTFPGFNNYSSEIPKNGRLNVTLKKGSSTYKTNEAAFFPKAKVIKKSGISYLVGSVTDKNGNPLKGIDVLVPMQKIKTSTDKDGEFKLQLNVDTGRAIFGIPEKGGEYRKVVPLEFGN